MSDHSPQSSGAGHRAARPRAGGPLLCGIREFERQHLAFLETILDRDLVCAIAAHEAARAPLTMKRLALLDLGSLATVQRRLRRLRRLGAIRLTRSRADGRVTELRLAPKSLDALARFEHFVQSGARSP